MLSPAEAGDNLRSLIFFTEIREFVPFLVFLRRNTKIFLEYLDEIALRAEAEKITYFRIGVLRECEQISSFLSLCLTDIVAESDACFRLEKSREISRADLQISRCILDHDLSVKMIADIIQSANDLL